MAGTTHTDIAAIPTIITGPNRQNPISLAARATRTSVSEKTAAAPRPHPTVRSALPRRTPGCIPTKATPAVPRAAPTHRFGATPPGKNTAPKSAVITTLVPKIGVATETSPPDNARNVAIWPRKNRPEQAGAQSQIQSGSPGGGGFAQNKSGNENSARERLQATMPWRAEWFASSERFNNSAPIA